MMMKALVRKQFGEYFTGYFVDRKTGKPVPRKKVIGKFIGFGVLCLVLCAMFSGLAFALGQMLQPAEAAAPVMSEADIQMMQQMTEEGGALLPGMEAGMEVNMPAALPESFDPARLYFTLLGIMAILMGTFGSVFNTYAGMYLAKDNDLLLSMPIPPRKILLSRLIGVYGLSLLYSGMIWLPACVVYAIMSPSVTAAAVIMQIILLFVIPVFVSVLTCILGWVVALVSGKLKNRGIVTVLISLVCLGAYYAVCFRMGDMLESLINNGAKVDAALNTWVRFLCLQAEGASGNVLSGLIFILITAALAVITFFVLSRSFTHIALRSAPAGNSAGKAKKASEKAMKGTEKVKSARMALLGKELKRFVSSPTYMLNAGLGLVMLPVVAVIMLMNAGNVTAIVDVLGEMTPLLKNLVCPAVLLIAGFMAAMNMISTPSVSLEGKNLWILRSLPVTGKQVLQAKLMLHMLIGSLPVCASVLILGIAVKCTALQCALMVIFAFLFNAYNGLFGLIVGVKRPVFNWTNETYPIKQSSNILLSMLAGWGANLLLPGLCWAGGLIMDATLSLALTTALLGIICFLLLKYMNTRSAAAFDRL